MNCQKGDWAVIVRSIDDPTSIGKIVRCIEAYIPVLEKDERPAWVVDPPKPPYSGIYDHCLKPISPQPDDATDEMVARLGTPMQRQLNALEREIDLLNKSLDRLDKVLTQQPERG